MRYFIVSYVRRMVRQGLYMKEQMDEIVSVSKKTKTRDYQSSAVILDFFKRQVEIASMNGVTLPKDFQKIRDYYYQHYPKVIDDLEAAVSRIHSSQS
jgi:hypothetical protein